MAGTLPDLYAGVAFNAEPFDPSAVPVWVDLSTRFTGLDTATRGRTQYELSQGQTGQTNVSWIDPDEALNPGNPSSPYAPYVQPYRQFSLLAMWPPNGTGNILPAADIDGSFESYTVGTVPSWWSGGSAPAVVGSGAWQGTKAFQFTVPASSAQAGRYTIPCIPGRQYTLQTHLNLGSAATAMLALEGQTVAVDTFGRTTVAGIGTPVAPTFFGPAWTLAGTAADFSTAAGSAFISCGSVNARHVALTGSNIFDSSQLVTHTMSAIPTAGAAFLELHARYVDSNNSYFARVVVNPSGVLTANIVKRVAGVETTMVTVSLPGTFVVGTMYHARFDVVGNALSYKVWTGPNQPAAFNASTTDTVLTTPASIGFGMLLNASYTGTLPNIGTFQDYRATGSVCPSSARTTTTGSYQLLTLTFTATQPQHVVRTGLLAVVGSDVTMTIDGLQVEPGASANTFTTSGPIVQSCWTRGYVERWPSTWDTDSAGFFGICQTPVLGASFIPATTDIGTEYRSALMATVPDYVWTLQEPNPSRSFGETSGNGGPPLQRLDEYSGPAGTYAPGTAMNIAGDPQGNGVSITGQLPGLPDAATILTTGNRLGQPLAIGSQGAAWGFSMSFWGKTSDTSNTLSGSWAQMSNATFAAGIGNGPFFEIATDPAGVNTPQFFVGLNGNGQQTPAVAGAAYLDGISHHFVGTFSLASNAYTINLYVDGVLIGTKSGTATTDYGASNLDGRLTYIDLFGQETFPFVAFSINAGINGVMSYMALWARTLTAAEVATLTAAGKGYPNENSGTRVARYLALSGYVGPTDIAQGMTTMGVSTLGLNTAALGVIQSTQDTEFGNFYESHYGVAFRGRNARYLALTPSYVFGENVAAGEYPYLMDLLYDFDPTYVANNATITRSGGIVAYAQDSTFASQRRYGPKPFTRTVGGNSDNEAQDMANYVIANYSQSRQRLAVLTFDLAATRGVTASPDGTLWYMGLKLEIGTRVTVKRRAKAANNGAGLTLSGDYFIEAITPQGINLEAGTYRLQLLLSPVPTTQAWILEDPTYSVLNSTTIPAF